LLAVAIAKEKDEPKVLKEYESQGGRGRITRRILGAVPNSTARSFESALHVLHFWRDDASHGVATTITEIEAHASLTQLLRLAQFSVDHWAELTSSAAAAGAFAAAGR
jgi:hypothetical protein